MPTPAETAQAVRGAATVNGNALDSVVAEIDARLLDVELWPNSPSKGSMRDQLHRLRAAYSSAKRAAGFTAAMATRVLNLLGAPPAPDPVPAATTWSTGAW